MLKIADLKLSYGDIEVLHGISLEVNEGELVALVGANAAGKTTILRTISGILKPASGNIEFTGKQIVGIPPEKIVELGVIQIPEGRRLFPFMTILDNLEMGAYTARARKDKKENLEKVYELLPILYERRNRFANTLSGGQQQMLAVGRALMASPKLLMLDEPTMGLAPKIVQHILDIISKINADGISVLLVEQNVKHALEMAHRGYVMESGNIVMQGDSRNILQDDYLRKAYLGM